MYKRQVQESTSKDEFETVVDRSMTATENVKAVKPAKPAHEMPTKHMINADGTLSKLSLAKLEKIVVDVCRRSSRNGGPTVDCYIKR